MDEFSQYPQHGGDAVYSAHVKRFGEIEESLSKLRERVSIMESTQAQLVEGVSNFRDFQVTARDFFARADERARTEEAFHNRRDQEIKDAFILRHQENVAKLSEIGAGLNKKTLIWNIAGVLVGITAIVVAVCIAIMTARSAHLTDLRKLFVEGNHPQVYAVSTLPNMR
jgi:hypothetical protein